MPRSAMQRLVESIHFNLGTGTVQRIKREMAEGR